ncbi:serine/threonine protein kinase [Minicystis rosea]|nr:serine/threonine protein kinase [Minicystis rosea]
MSFMPRPISDPPLPAAIGRYEVVRVLGEGAMGRVLLAHDPVLDRDVAIKHLRGDLKIPRDVREGLLTRMRHEARAAARVPHPNLVVLHDMGEDPAVGLFLVFEYVEGPTLKQRVAREGRVPPPEAARLARDLGSALTTAHEAGILHRDVKPENVMLAKTGGKIADFGIARIPDSTLTHQGGLMGTPAYSAPETFRAGKFSPASDQFSLAASLYEAISGRRAFPGDDAVAVAAKIAHDDAERFATALGLPPAVDDILSRALARAPEERFPSCEAFGAELARALEAPAAAAIESASIRTPLGAGPAIPAAGEAPPTERKLGQVILGAAVVVATAALLMRAATRSAETPPPSTAVAASPPPPASVSAARPRPINRPRLHPRAEPSAIPSQAPAAPEPSTSAAVPAPSAAPSDGGAAPGDSRP